MAKSSACTSTLARLLPGYMNGYFVHRINRSVRGDRDLDGRIFNVGYNTALGQRDKLSLKMLIWNSTQWAPWCQLQI